MFLAAMNLYLLSEISLTIQEPKKRFLSVTNIYRKHINMKYMRKVITKGSKEKTPLQITTLGLTCKKKVMS